MVNIETKYAGLTLRNPIIIGSSGLTNNAEQNKNSKSSKVLKANSLIWTKMIKTIKYHNLNKI